MSYQDVHFVHRQDKRPTEVEDNPKAPFSLTAGVGTTPHPLHAQLVVPSNTGAHFTPHEWMEES